MDQYLIFVVILLLLAVMDLTVGVANDAVNFLSSAIGSKAASFKVIMVVAALGVMAGVTFSSGLMEVARKGIFNPQYFLMAELLVIFTAVMFQDILLLDLYNTFGLPTSTTVSIVFGLFGSALAMSVIKITDAGADFGQIFTYINSANVIKIVSGIFLSIVVAFIVGSLIQYLTRMLFTFDFEKKFKRWGSLWGGLALTCITFFIILKGAKGASFMTADVSTWIKSNLGLVSIYSFVGWVVLLQLLMWFTKINILKVIVLIGTFSLAMAFAANDLVNFIGAPLAGLNTYQIAHASGGDPLTATMEALSEPFKANTWLLLLSGAIMVGTLYISKKARSVTKTTISLGSQNEGVERFESNAMARGIVRMVIVLFDIIKKITPEPISKKISARFDLKNYKPVKAKDGEVPAFDLVRASVILMVSAAIISFATSLKLPLSTTYVTFIVAMAAALPDKAWGRETAVYRVSGVLTVIGGWFLTALMASAVAFVIAFILYYLEVYGLLGMAVISATVVIRSKVTHKKRAMEEEEEEVQASSKDTKTPEEETVELITNIGKMIKTSGEIIRSSHAGLFNQNLKTLKKARKKAKKLRRANGYLINDLIKMARLETDRDLIATPNYAATFAAIGRLTENLFHLAEQNYNYLDNNHSPLTEDQINELIEVGNDVNTTLMPIFESIETLKFDKTEKITEYFDLYTKRSKIFYKNQLERVRHSTANIKRSRLFLDNITDIQAVMEASRDLYKTTMKGYASMGKNN